jgi:hypothetical protein
MEKFGDIVDSPYSPDVVHNNNTQNDIFWGNSEKF